MDPEITPPNDVKPAAAEAVTPPVADETNDKHENIAEKILDFTFGVAVLTAETLSQAVASLVDRGKVAQEHAPAIVDAIMEKGKPARENLLKGVREDMLQAPKKADEGTAATPPANASNEISVLEARVKTLEQQLGSTSGAAADPTQSSDAAVTGNDTATDSAAAEGEIRETPVTRADATPLDGPTDPAASEAVNNPKPDDAVAGEAKVIPPPPAPPSES